VVVVRGLDEKTIYEAVVCVVVATLPREWCTHNTNIMAF
jgi:hypothetical protein